MQTLNPDYLVELARQFSFVCAFLGGFAATFMATLLVVSPSRRIGGWAIGASACAAVAFIVGALAASMLIVVLHPHAPANITGMSAVTTARVMSGMGFLIGIHALLAAIGLSGWLRSREVGIVTSLFALFGDAATWIVTA